MVVFFFFFQAEDGIRDDLVTGVQTCALPIFSGDFALQGGDLAKAEECYRRAFVIRKRLDPGGPQTAISLRNLGHVAEMRGELEKADERFREALRMREKLLPGSLEVANSLDVRGYVAEDRGDSVLAGRYYRRALSIWEKIVPDSLYVAQGFAGLGSVAKDRGDSAEAENYLQRALAIWRRIVPDSLNVAWGLAAIGDATLDRGETAQAEGYYRQALAIHEKLASDNVDRAEILAALARIMRWKQPQAATHLYEQAVTLLENQMGRLGGAQEVRIKFRAKHAAWYKEYADLLLAQNEPELAFYVMERSHARGLLETLAAAHVDIRKGADPALLQQERSLEQSILAKYKRRMGLLNDEHNQEQASAVTRDSDGLLAQYHDVQGQIRSGNPIYAALTQPRPLTVLEVQRQWLDADTVLLEYPLGEERSYVLAVSSEPITAYQLPKRSRIESAARQVYDLLTARNRGKKGQTAVQKIIRVSRSDAEYPQAAARLSRMILGPIASLAPGKRLLIVSDGILQYVPFTALPAPGEESAFVPLVSEHEIVTLPSASVLQVLKQQRAGRPGPSGEVAVLADPVFTRNDPRVKPDRGRREPASATPGHDLIDSGSVSRGVLLRSATDVGLIDGAMLFPRLIYTRHEADAILRQTSAGAGKRSVDFEASRSTATSPELAHYQIIHFATHGLLNNEHPELSGLVFSLVDDRGLPQEGFLMLGDIYNLDLSSEMVVLSACETALGKDIQGEGLVGITRGFMYAGASRVVASLWKVDDAATAELMGKFYEGILKDRLHPAAALKKAQVEMRKKKRWSSPYYWAGFVMQGEW